MANTTNLLAIAPTKPAASARTTTAQPKHRPATRTAKRNFGTTLDRVNAKLDDAKQSISELQEPVKKQPPDVPDKNQAQGTSDTPQDAPQAAITDDESKVIATEGKQPADIFFRAETLIPKPDDHSVLVC